MHTRQEAYQAGVLLGMMHAGQEVYQVGCLPGRMSTLQINSFNIIYILGVYFAVYFLAQCQMKLLKVSLS